MQVVYSPAHLAHDIDTETFMGVGVPANEVAERAERIRTALEADGGFDARRTHRARRRPDHRGPRPWPGALPRGGLVGAARPRTSRARSCRPTRIRNRAMFEGMSDEAIARLVREPRHVGGRAGFWGLDSAAPLVAGTYVAARAAVDVALTTVDLVLGGETAAYGLCRPPGHHAARAMYGGYCFFNNAAIAAARDHPGAPASGSRSSTSTTTTATARSRSSGAAATCATSRSTPTRTGSTRTSWAVPTRPGRATAPGRT